MQIVRLEEVKKALDLIPNGFGDRPVTSFERYSLLPTKVDKPSIVTDQWGYSQQVVLDPNGLIVLLHFDLGKAPRPLDELKKMPDNLIVAVPASSPSQASANCQRLVRKLVLGSVIKLKIHEYLGQPSMLYSELPELLQVPTEVNAEAWIRWKLDQKYPVAQLVKDIESKVSVKIYAIPTHPDKWFTESEILKMLPKLPKASLPRLCYDGNVQRQFKLKAENLFALFGNAEGYLAFLEQ